MIISSELKKIQTTCEDEKVAGIIELARKKIAYYEKQTIKTASIEKQALILQIILKVLKAALIAIAGLLMKSPLKAYIAYNSLSKLISLIEKGKIK